MAIVTHTTVVDSTGGDSTARWYYSIKSVLTGVYGWTVAGSGDGSAGAMDAVDRIASFSDMTSQWGWFVLQSPHATPSDRIQILLTRSSSTSTRGSVSYDPQANYVGGGASAYPTSATAFEVVGTTTTENSVVRMTYTGDTSTHWFALLVTQAGVPTNSRMALAVFPLTNQVAGAGKPYAVFATPFNNGYTSTNVSSSSASVSVSSTGAQWGLGPALPAPGLSYRANTTEVIPGNLLTSAAGEDVNFPVIHGLNQSYYFGVNAAAMWNGTERSSLTTLDGLNRIVFDDINLPWDGVTQPQA